MHDMLMQSEGKILLCELSSLFYHLEGLRAVGNISLKMTGSTHEGLWNLNFGGCLQKTMNTFNKRLVNMA